MNDRFAKIIHFYNTHGRMPSYSEIMSVTGLQSKNGVFKVVGKMVDAGLISKDLSGRIIPRGSMVSLPLLGTVEAGFSTYAEQDTREMVSIDDYLVENRESSFLLRVQGESMIDAGIMPGDMVLVERGIPPHEGDIVIAEVDHGWTMKYFHRKGKEVLLVPANKKFAPIKAKQQLRIAAIVKGVIRKY